MKKFLSIFIAVAMVMSFASVFTGQAPVAKANGADLNVVILSPKDAASVTVEDIFYVDAVISNKGATPVNTTATLTIDNNAVILDTPTKTITLGDHGTTDVWWKVQCTALGAANLTVTAGTGSATVKVLQGGEAEEKILIVRWIETPCTQEDLFPVDSGLPQVPVGTEFTVKADIESLFDCANNVKVTIGYSGDLELLTPETVTINNICSGEDQDAAWKFKCTGEGNASVYIKDVTAKDAEGNDLDPGQIDLSAVSGEDGECDFYQGPSHPVTPQGDWTIDVNAPEKVCTNCAQNNFQIKATATNPDEQHGGTEANDVYAELTIGDYTLATFEDFDQQRQYVGTVNPGDTTTPIISWDITCLRKGPTDFTVTFYKDGTSALGSGTPVKSQTVTVNQNTYMVTVDDVYPGDDGFIKKVGDDVYETESCNTFFVDTTFKNCTCDPVSDVIAHVTLDNNAELTGFVTVQEYTVDEEGNSDSKGTSYQVPASAVINNGYNLDLTTDCACCYFEVTWQFKCLGSDACTPHDVIFSAYKDSVADDNLLDSDSFKLLQKSSPKLSAGISVFPGWFSDGTLGTTEITGVASACDGGSLGDNSNFTVVIPVANLGDVTAEDVYVKIEMNGAFTVSDIMGIDGTGSITDPLTSVDGDLVNNDYSTFYIGTLNGLCAGGNAYKILIEGTCNGDPDVHITVGDKKFDPTKLEGGENLADNSLIKFYDVNGNGVWDNGEPIVYDSDDSDDVSTGDIAIQGSLPANGTGLTYDSLLKFHDENGNSVWDNGETVVYNTDDSGAYSLGLSGTDSLTGEPIPFKDACGSLNFYLPEEKTLQQIPLDFELVEPALESSIYVGDCIFPKIIVENCSQDGNVIQGFTATLSITDGSEFGRIDTTYAPATQTFDALSGVNGSTTNIWEPSWHVCCTGMGDVTYEITLFADNPGMTLTKTFVVHQLPVGNLGVEILSPADCSVYATGQEFAVTAEVSYTSTHAGLPAEGVVVGIESSYAEVVYDSSKPQGSGNLPAEIDLGEIPDGYDQLFTWTMRAVEPTEEFGADLTVYADGLNVTSDDVGICARIYPAAKLVVSNLELTDESGAPITDVEKGTDFIVKGTIANIGWADASSVKLTLTGSDNIMPAPGDNSFVLDVGTVPAQRPYLDEDGNKVLQDSTVIPFEFHVQCEDAGKTTITVTPSGADEYGFSWLWENRDAKWPSEQDEAFIEYVLGVYWHGESNSYALKSIPDFCIEPSSLTFKQVIPEGPMLEVTAPEEGFATNSPDITVTYSATGGTEPYTFAAKVDDAAWVSPIPTDSYTFHGLADGAHTLYIEVVDSNALYYIGFVNVVVDTTPPDGSVVINGGAAKTNDPDVTLDVSATDANGPIEYSLDDSIWSATAPTSAVLPAGDGMKTVTVYFKDALGNESSASDTIELDTTPPSVSITTPGIIQAQKTFQIAYGSAASDVAYYEVSLNGGLWINNELNTTYTFGGLVEGDNTLCVRATDDVGNVGPVAFITVTVNTELPVVTIDPVTSPTTLNYGTITYSATGGVPPYTYRVKVNNGGWNEWSSNTSFDYMGLVEGANTIAVEAKDSLGKTGAANVSIVVDTTAPPAPSANPIGGIYNAEQTVTLSDAEAGVSICYTTDGTIPTTSSTLYTVPISIGEGITTLKAIAVDAVGNVSDVMTEVYNVVVIRQVSVTLDLSDGWNLISTPFETSVSNLGSNVDQTYEWDGVFWNPATTLEPGVGYLIHHSGSESITLNGVPTASPFTLAVNGTWQIIGDPFEPDVAVPWHLIGGFDSISMAFYWDGSFWQSVNLTTDSMQPGVGYLILTSDVGTLTFQRP